MAEAVINILGERASDEIGPQLMVVCRGLIKHPPIGGNFKQAARRLLTVWAALQAVDVSPSCALRPSSSLMCVLWFSITVSTAYTSWIVARPSWCPFAMTLHKPETS